MSNCDQLSSVWGSILNITRDRRLGTASDVGGAAINSIEFDVFGKQILAIRNHGTWELYETGNEDEAGVTAGQWCRRTYRKASCSRFWTTFPMPTRRPDRRMSAESGNRVESVEFICHRENARPAVDCGHASEEQDEK